MSEDLISKQTAYKVLSEYYHHKTEMQHKALREALDRVPPVELQPTCNKIATSCNQLATDCISRQAAIDEINHICPVDTEYDCTLLDRVDVRCVLSDLPPAEPRWIPVTERLPETVERFTDAENVLAHDDGTVEFFGVFTEYESDPVLVEGIAEGEHGIFTAIYSMWKYEDGAVETAWLDNIISDIEIKNVTAWMPLPEPWKGEDDG